MKAFSFFALGLVFALGLGISGMTQPLKVLGFLDVAGTWDPALMFVMVGAIAVTFTGYRLVLKRPSPLLGARFEIPTRRSIDGQLIAGGALFGLGWGMAGFCPGPAIVALAGGSVEVVLFVLAMFVGFITKDLAIKIRPSVESNAAANG